MCFFVEKIQTVICFIFITGHGDQEKRFVMQQDFQSLKEEYFQPLMEASDSLPLPIAFTDDELRQTWENSYLKKYYPFLQGRNTLLSLLHGYDIDALIASMKGQDSCFSIPSRLPMAETVITLSPLYDADNVFIGTTAHFSVSSLELFPCDSNRAQEMLKNFNTTLRDPLNSIFSGLSAMARRLEIDDVAACEPLVQQMNHSCYHLLKSCNSLSEYTAYANGLAVLNLKLISLKPYLTDLFGHMQMVTRKTGIRLCYTLPEEEIDLNLDPDKLMIVLSSLISNSMAFFDESCSDKSIDITVAASKRSVRFVISDNGMGIPAEVLPYVFEPYFTSDRHDLNFSHLGLGLTLCQMIVRHHGGEISAVSGDTGTTVTFTLSRSLKGSQDGELTFCDNPIDYISNSYSPMYIYLSDVCDWIAI